MLISGSRLLRALFAAGGVALAAGSAAAQTVVFDFNTAPTSSSSTSGGYSYNPVYVDAGSGFTLTHAPGTNGRAKWQSAAGPIILASVGTGTPISAVISFSEPVTAFSIDVSNNTYTTTQLIAQVDGGGTQTQGVPYNDGVDTLYTFGDGPYTSVTVTTGTTHAVSWDSFSVTLEDDSYPPDATSLRGVDTPAGDDVNVITLDAFEMRASSVAEAGETNADYCVGLDPRQIKIRGRDVYTPRWLSLREVAGTGSCKGSLPDDPTLPVGYRTNLTWDKLLTLTDLKIAPWYRSFQGKFTPPGDVETTGYWIVVAVVRSSAELDGEVAVKTIPEELITYPAGATIDGELKCNTILDRRPLALGGAVTAFGEYPNVEGNKMIMETAQCNRPASIGRRTTHAYPMALDGFLFDEVVNLANVLDGLDRTLTQAQLNCSSLGTNVSVMRGYIASARVSILRGRWTEAVTRLENVARTAKLFADFSTCTPGANFKGSLVARSISAAFTVWDRFKHRASGISWQIYKVPGDLDIPLLTSDAPPVVIP